MNNSMPMTNTAAPNYSLDRDEQKMLDFALMAYARHQIKFDADPTENTFHNLEAAAWHVYRLCAQIANNRAMVEGAKTRAAYEDFMAEQIPDKLTEDQVKVAYEKAGARMTELWFGQGPDHLFAEVFKTVRNEAMAAIEHLMSTGDVEEPKWLTTLTVLQLAAIVDRINERFPAPSGQSTR